jgi:excisionase family DNA binding protein
MQKKRLTLEECPDVLTVQQVASVLGVTDHLVYILMERNDMKSFRVGRYRKVSKKTLSNFINGISEETAKAPSSEVAAPSVTPLEKTVYSAEPKSKPTTLAELF